MANKTNGHLTHEESRYYEEMFIDGIYGLSYSSGAFRFDLVSVHANPESTQASTNPSQEPQKQIIRKHARVIMTPQGYIQTLNALKQFLADIEKQGVIKKQTPNTNS